MVFLTPKEALAVQLALGSMMEDLNAMKSEKYINVPWTPEARKDQRDIMASAKSAARKIEKITGVEASLPEYKPGDENEFLTKES